MSEAIHVRGLTRRFHSLVAVDHIDFDVATSEVFGFLGPNGAGKTTTISMLTTLLRPSAGEASVAGHDVVTQGAAVRAAIGIVFQEQSLDERLTAAENLDFHAVLYHVPRRQRRERIARALELVDLSDRAGDMVERFSGGMKRRLEIARGLMHTPSVLFLDEPTIGLDPQTRRSLWDHIRRLREETGITIFMTTHYMEEAEFCDRIAIIDHARIVALDSPEGLKRTVGGDVVTVTTPDREDLLAHLAANGLGGEIRDGEVRFEAEDGARLVPAVARDFTGRIDRMELKRPTLDDVFLKTTGRTIREAELGGKEVARNRMRRMMGVRGAR